MVKPRSISRFEGWYFFAIALSLASTALGWSDMSSYTDAVIAESGASSRSLGFVLLFSSVVMFLVLALIVWGAIVLSRLGAARWVLAALVAYAAYAVAMRAANIAIELGLIADIAAVASAAIAVSFLFRADAKAWFGRDDGQVSDQG